MTNRQALEKLNTEAYAHWILVKARSIWNESRDFYGLVKWLDAPAMTQENKNTQWNEIPIAELGLSVRAYSLLHGAGIGSVGELLRLRKYDLMCLRHGSPGVAGEVAEKVYRFTGEKMPL